MKEIVIFRSSFSLARTPLNSKLKPRKSKGSFNSPEVQKATLGMPIKIQNCAFTETVDRPASPIRKFLTVNSDR